MSKMNLIKKILIKIFNKNKYLEYKLSERNKSNFFIYKNKIETNLLKIIDNIKKKKKIKFFSFWTLWRYNFLPSSN